jgi:sugar phosphate isomerase/epimerase
MTRRELLAAPALASQAAAPAAATTFQIGCLTLPYAPFPLERALEGIAKAGCRYVGWAGSHLEAGGERKPALAVDAPPAEAKRLAGRCRDRGLEPVMLFAGVGMDTPDCVPGHTRRIGQAAAAGIPFVVSFGKTTRGNYDVWIRNLKELAPVARKEGVIIALKPHGGNTGTGRDCARIVADVGDPAVRICYDSGNVLDYEKVDPLPDIQACWREVACFTIKDHRNTPQSQDCGPGLGEIDQYKLLLTVLGAGRAVPLICENVSAPLVARPANPEGVDGLVARSREFLEIVVAGLQAFGRLSNRG